MVSKAGKKLWLSYKQFGETVLHTSKHLKPSILTKKYYLLSQSRTASKCRFFSSNNLKNSNPQPIFYFYPTSVSLLVYVNIYKLYRFLDYLFSLVYFTQWKISPAQDLTVCCWYPSLLSSLLQKEKKEKKKPTTTYSHIKTANKQTQDDAQIWWGKILQK